MSIIRDLRRKSGLSQAELAELCCVHQTAVSQWENGRTVPDRNSLQLLASVFGVSVETLLGLEKPQDKNRIMGFERANAETIEQRLGKLDLFALAVTDSSMSPVLQEGDTVVISRSKEIENGDIAAVTIGKSDIVIKRIIKKGTSLLLVPENSVFEPIVFSNEEIEALPVTILGRVMEMRRKF